MGNDFWVVVQWWGTLFLVGAGAFPLTKLLFASWYDRGYLFAKAVGLALVTYLVYILATLHLVPFGVPSILLSLGVVFAVGLLFQWKKARPSSFKRDKKRYMSMGIIIGMEELFFFLALLLWAWVKGHEANIEGLEKFMDFGFTKAILNSAWFPAPDMWYSGYPINYYYFGHTVMAMLTKLSGLDLRYTFNLMLASLFAFTFTMSYAIGTQLALIRARLAKIRAIISGFLSAFLVSLAGNMQTLYAFTRGYTGEDVHPFWELTWGLGEFWAKLPEGLERYWYANATRFIPFTIHEFPSYSFVVSDVHGHVLSLPFVLLAIGLLIQIFGVTGEKKHEGSISHEWLRVGVYGLLVSILLMTNALDGPIYLGLFVVLYAVLFWRRFTKKPWWRALIQPASVLTISVLASVPFLSHFTSFVSGVAVNCPPWFLANSKLGLLLFEGVEKCQKSPLWMMWLLWGFFWFCGLWWMATKTKWKFGKLKLSKYRISFTEITQTEIILVVFFFFSLALLIFPEFFYFKDIYPAHFRSNTMFKLGYDAFILFSFLSAYAIVQMRSRQKLFYILLIPQLFLVSIYPIFSVRSYFDSLRRYKGLDGFTWIQTQYPDDYEGIRWLNAQIPAYRETYGVLPVIVEADGDSYTHYARYSAFTGLPAVIGWPVHEWLWRGTYDIVAPRREDVRLMYELEDIEQTRELLMKYGVTYIIVGSLEREKYPALIEDKFEQLGTRVFSWGDTKIYQITRRSGSP